MSDYIEWGGGEMPVAPHALVKVLRRDRQVSKAIAWQLNWYHLGADSDIVAYQRYYPGDDTFSLDPVRYKITERHQNVQFKMLDDLATPPLRSTDGSAGWDLYNAEGEYVIKPGFRTRIRTGVSVAIPEGWCGQVWPRSGMAFAHGYDTLAGLIDNDYRREIMVLMINHGKHDMEVQKGDRIGQLVVVPCLTTSYIVDELPETTVPHDGWGSSGK